MVSCALRRDRALHVVMGPHRERASRLAQRVSIVGRERAQRVLDPVAELHELGLRQVADLRQALVQLGEHPQHERRVQPGPIHHVRDLEIEQRQVSETMVAHRIEQAGTFEKVVTH